MSGLMIRRTVVMVTLAVAAGGCATQERQRIALLEETNRNLTERLNLAYGDLGTLGSDRDDLNQRLQVAIDEADALRQELEARPVPQEAAAGWTPVPGGAMIAIQGHVLFNSGKVTIRSEARRALEAIVSAIQGEYADKDILVFGHTDDTPIKSSGWMDNYQISTERALSVVRYLRDRGVAPRRLVAAGCGEHRQRVPNASEVNRATNRRVEVFAVDPGSFTQGS